MTAPSKSFAAMMAMLSEMFGRQVTDVLVEGYWIALQDLTEDELQTATQRALAECKFMPAPAEIRELSGRRQKRLAAAEAREFERVRRISARLDSWRGELPAKDEWDPDVQKIIRELAEAKS